MKFSIALLFLFMCHASYATDQAFYASCKAEPHYSTPHALRTVRIFLGKDRPLAEKLYNRLDKNDECLLVPTNATSSLDFDGSIKDFEIERLSERAFTALLLSVRQEMNVEDYLENEFIGN